MHTVIINIKDYNARVISDDQMDDDQMTMSTTRKKAKRSHGLFDRAKPLIVGNYQVEPKTIKNS